MLLLVYRNTKKKKTDEQHLPQRRIWIHNIKQQVNKNMINLNFIWKFIFQNNVSAFLNGLLCFRLALSFHCSELQKNLLEDRKFPLIKNDRNMCSHDCPCLKTTPQLLGLLPVVIKTFFYKQLDGTTCVWTLFLIALLWFKKVRFFF